MNGDELEAVIGGVNEFWVEAQTTLFSAVKRERATDLKMTDEQEAELQQRVYSMVLVWLFAHLQAYLEDGKWGEVVDDKKRQTAHPQIDWARFEVLKFMRDCCAHRSSREVFSANSKRTKVFKTYYDSSMHNYYKTAQANGLEVLVLSGGECKATVECMKEIIAAYA